MRPLEARKYLFDIQHACKLISEFTAGKSFSDYADDPMLRSAVERQFEVVGEALSRLLTVDPSLVDQISDTRRIIAFRNRLIHGYASVADDVVWGVVESNLPVLQREVAALLGTNGT